MDFLKALFEKGAITWDEFVQGVTTSGYKLADLSKGDYVSSKKHMDELNAKDTVITDLNSQIATRDTDIGTLKKQLEDGDVTAADTIENLRGQITKYQTDYSTAKTEFEQRLGKQAYEFAVKDFANSKKFSSNAAKRDFINEMISQDLKMKDNKILGADDFATTYSTANADAFVEEGKGGDPNLQHKTEPDVNKPTFIQPTPPQPTSSDDNAFLSAFNFTGVRPHENK